MTDFTQATQDMAEELNNLIEEEPADNLSQEGSSQEEEEVSVESSQDDDIPGWNLDIESLPDDIKPLAKSLQGDYTRKTQRLAELRRSYESLGPVEQLEQAVALSRALQSNPVGTLRNLERGLAAMGLLQQQPEAPAAPGSPLFGQNAAPQQQQQDPLVEKLLQEYSPDDPVVQLAVTVKSELDSLRQEREALSQQHQSFLAQQLQAQQQLAESQAEKYFVETENKLRQAHPEWDDDDFDYIYDIALSTGGDLELAAERFEHLSNRTVSKYLQRKLKQPTGSGAVSQGALGEVRQDAPKTLSEATKAMQAELESLINAGEFNLNDLTSD